MLDQSRDFILGTREENEKGKKGKREKGKKGKREKGKKGKREKGKKGKREKGKKGERKYVLHLLALLSPVGRHVIKEKREKGVEVPLTKKGSFFRKMKSTIGWLE